MGAAIAAAQIKADSDPLRPGYHFHPPSQWINDPNGTIYADGYYHVFYQYNPFNDWWDHMHWGHARTKDFISWEHLPIALCPDDDEKEIHCFSGCCVFDKQKKPTILYTSVSPDRDTLPHRQRAAFGDLNLLEWKKVRDPVLEIKDAPPGTRSDWRDPYVFSVNGQYFMVVGAVIPWEGEDKAAVLLFQAKDNDLLEWGYCHPLFVFDAEIPFPECPNYLPLQGRWLLIVSPFGPVRYYASKLNATPENLVPDRNGFIDYSSGYYATNTIIDSHRTILLGWIRGFPKGRGWNGCHALPRELEFDSEGTLLQKPLAELKSLRGVSVDLTEKSNNSRHIVIDDVPVWSMELHCSLSLPRNSRAAIRFVGDEDPIFSIETEADSGIVHAEGIPVSISNNQGKERDISFLIFADKSVVEIFIDEGRHCVTRVAENLLSSNRVVIDVEGGATVVALRYWKIKPIAYYGYSTQS